MEKKNDIKRDLPPIVVRRKHQQLSSLVQLMYLLCQNSFSFFAFHQVNLSTGTVSKCGALY